MDNVKDLVEKFAFLEKQTEEEYDHEFTKKFIIDNITLPAFYTFDPKTPEYKVNVAVETGDILVITITDEEGEAVGGTYSDLEEAYDYVKNVLKGDVVFTGNLKAATGSDEDMMVSVPSASGYRRMLLSSTSSDEEWLAKANYLQWLKETVAYEKNPTDFYTSFHWLDGHPALWTRYKEDTNQWETSNNAKVWLGLTKDDKGEVVFMLEAGSAVEPARTTTYHDLRLDVYEKSYEEAFVALAALVHKFFDVDGSERENVDYQKSDLEITLDERVKEMHAHFDSQEDEESPEVPEAK